MTKTARPLAEAQQVAQAVIADLAPWCDRIEVAGSVRRGKAEVGDIELVAIPSRESTGLFGDQHQSALYGYLQRTEAVFLKGNNPTGKYHQLLLADGMQVDLFTADPDNFGLILLIRTGSADFSRSMLARWKSCQRIGPEQSGCVNGRLMTRTGVPVPTPEEADVFRLCHVDWQAPERRTAAVQV